MVTGASARPALLALKSQKKKSTGSSLAHTGAGAAALMASLASAEAELTGLMAAALASSGLSPASADAGSAALMSTGSLHSACLDSARHHHCLQKRQWPFLLDAQLILISISGTHHCIRESLQNAICKCNDSPRRLAAEWRNLQRWPRSWLISD